MFKISSPLSFIYKIVCFFNGFIFLILSLFFLYKKDITAFILILTPSVILILIAIRVKYVVKKNNDLIIKGFFSKEKVNIDTVQTVGNIFLLFYLQTNNNKRYYFMNTFKDQITALTKGSELVQKDILKEIKKRV